jgi:hypothetical protein
MRQAFRTQDDCDGEMSDGLFLIQGGDGDMHISTDGVKFLRFRIPVFGGGLSENTYDALVALMEAMEVDNEEKPICAK